MDCDGHRSQPFYDGLVVSFSFKQEGQAAGNVPKYSPAQAHLGESEHAPVPKR